MEYTKFYPDETKPSGVTQEFKTALAIVMLGSIRRTLEQLPGFDKSNIDIVDPIGSITLSPKFSLIEVTDIDGNNQVTETHRARINSSFTSAVIPYPVELEFVRELLYRKDFTRDLLKPFSVTVKFSDGSKKEIGCVGENHQSAFSRGTHTFKNIFVQGADLYNILVKPKRNLTSYKYNPREDGKYKFHTKTV